MNIQRAVYAFAGTMLLAFPMVGLRAGYATWTSLERLDNSVTVENDRKVPVTVYMEYGEFDRRLGTVPASSTATLQLPGWAVQSHQTIALFAHPEGEVDDLATQRFTLEAPGQLSMVIPPFGQQPASPADTMSAVIPPEEMADATLTVENPRSTPATVFASRPPFDIRLGTVPARGTATLRFPKSALQPDGSISIVIHPEGGMDLESQTLDVRKGNHLGIRIPRR